MLRVEGVPARTALTTLTYSVMVLQPQLRGRNTTTVSLRSGTSMNLAPGRLQRLQGTHSYRQAGTGVISTLELSRSRPHESRTALALAFPLHPPPRRQFQALASTAVQEATEGLAKGGVGVAKLEKIRLPWQWLPEDAGTDGKLEPISIHAVEYALKGAEHAGSGAARPLLLLLPALSDVSTVDEWMGFAASVLEQDAVGARLAKLPPGIAATASAAVGTQPRVVAVDFPGFGASGSPPLTYTAGMLEDFLVDFVSHVAPPSAPVVVVGAGHSATLALRAVAKDRVSPAAVVAVAPTWAGPLPIVFGNSDSMKSRYGIFRGLIRSPMVGWALYQYGLTSASNIRTQYLTHVYQDPANVTQELIQLRTEATRRPGGRFAPASFVTGLLDPVASRDEFLGLFAAAMERGVKTAVLASSGSPKRSKREMEALQGAPGVGAYSSVPGALLPHEEFPKETAEQFLSVITQS